MKRTIKILSFLLALVFALSMFVACETTDDSSEKVTVQWVQGQKVLKEEQVEKGSKITPWTPNFDGMEFIAGDILQYDMLCVVIPVAG